MRSRLLAGAVACGVLAAAAAAGAADLSRPYGYAGAAPVFTWTGFYVGANLGYAWGTSAFDSPGGVLGGIQAGYNYQFAGPVVAGVEADFDLSGVGAGTFSADYFSTVRARLGFAFDRVLLFGTGGVAIMQGNVAVAGLSSHATETGWTLGVGAELALDRAWSVKAEYLYLGFGGTTYPTVVGPVSTGFDGNVFRTGVNYRF